MTTRAIYEFDTNPNDNGFPPADGGFPEFMNRSDLNDALRVHLSELRKHYDDSEWIRVRTVGPDPADIGVFSRVLATQFTINLAGNDLSGFFTVGRIIKIVDGSGEGVDLVTQVASRSYSNPLTTVNIKIPASINVAASDVYVHSNSVMRALGLVDAADQFFIPPTEDSAGINAAIALADAAGGGTVLLTAGSYVVNNAGGPIDLTSKGSVIIQGAGPETQMIQAVGANMDAVITIGNLSKTCALRNLRIVAAFPSNPSGNGYGIEISGGIRPRLDSLIFVNCRTCIKITSTPVGEISITDCDFASYADFGVASTASTDIQRGQIVDCRFNGSTVTGVGAAAIKVAGRWQISNNTLRNIGHGSLDPRGIWLWGKVAGNTGGTDSVIEGNMIDGRNAINGTGIEIGSDGCVVDGNVVLAPASGIGIHLNVTQAGQTASGIVVASNRASQGSPIVVNQRIVDAVVSGNTASPSAGLVGIDVDGDNILVSGNTVNGGATGVRVSANASNARVAGNALHLSTASAAEVVSGASGATVNGNLLDVAGNGVLIGTTALNTLVRDNDIASSPSPIINNDAATTRTSGNVRSGTDYVDLGSATFVIVSTLEELLTGMIGRDIGLETETGFWRFWYDIKNNQAQSFDLRVYWGRNNDATDTLIDTISLTGLESKVAAWSHEFPVTNEYDLSADNAARLTMTVQVSGGTGVNMTVNSFFLQRISYV